ncbi:agamous-like MADS-box protein AGL61 [Impatiens glandulifera]|uniref:agamous-like MADS-box protein AGL61 n=1 Tax=Impatiens glandulifera TaxID=253017 RepID=UPI001FB11405|nr:agamous-like MADS-box protein AGL61 [Impatiens glandulifera]
MGKQKIEIKKIEKSNYRQVTFSKRRAGLFKKATELCVLTGANVLALVTSPGNRTFTFSSQPNPEDLLRRVIVPEKNHYECSASSLSNGLQTNHEMVLENRKYLNQRYEKLAAALEEEKKIGERLAAEEAGRRTFWWEEEVDVKRMGEEELECYLMALRKMKNNVDKILMDKKNDTFLVPNSPTMDDIDVSQYLNI